jgi:hypothetical protein
MYISGMYRKSSFTPAVTAATTNYTVGDSIGQKLTFSNVPDEGLINTVLLADKGPANKNVELWLFDADLAAVITDNGAFTPTNADILKCVGIIPIAVFNSAAANGVGQAKQCGVSYVLTPGESKLYGALVDRTGGYVFSATDAVTVTLQILR